MSIWYAIDWCMYLSLRRKIHAPISPSFSLLMILQYDITYREKEVEISFFPCAATSDRCGPITSIPVVFADRKIVRSTNV